MTPLKQTVATMVLLSGLVGASHADDRDWRFQRHGRDHSVPHREIRHNVEHRNEFRHREHGHRDHRDHGDHGDHHAQRQNVVRIVVNPWVANTGYVTPLRVARLPPAPLPAAEPVWYFCANPLGYFPYIGRCRVTWQTVPANTWSGAY